MIFFNELLFYVGKKPIGYGGMYILLSPDSWDDFGYKTSFSAALYDSSELITDIGLVKIAYLGDLTGDFIARFMTKTYLKQSFTKLDDRFCSLWQSDEAYIKVKKIEKDFGVSILESLNDVVTQIENIEVLLKNDVVSSSLFRFVSEFQCVNQFRRIYEGKIPLTNYEYEFEYDIKEENSNNSIKFEVQVKSLPPTNIHALIGSNGSGKTYTIQNIVQKFLAEPLDQRKVESVFLISFNPFDNYQTVFNQMKVSSEGHSKKEFNYIGVRNIDNSKKNKDVDEMTNQFLESYDACSRDLNKVEELNAFIADIATRFSNVKGLDQLSIPLKVLSNSYGTHRIKVEDIFQSLSAGYKEVVSIVVGTIGLMAEQSLVVMDEPENHLHPPLLSMLIRWLSNILIERNAFAIIATHSPIILQEIPRSCVWIIQRNGDIRKIRKPSIETFGANLSSLTYEVFRYEIDNSGFNCLLRKIANESQSYEEALKRFDGHLGDEARSRLRLLCYKEE